MLDGEESKVGGLPVATRCVGVRGGSMTARRLALCRVVMYIRPIRQARSSQARALTLSTIDSARRCLALGQLAIDQLE
jgi:hypothetical protein